MTVVIDVGAARYDDYFSMERLISEFSPTHLYAYDPNPALVLPENSDTHIELNHVAAWIYNGTIGYRSAGAWSNLTNDPQSPQVPCVDLVEVINDLSKKHSEPLVLKLDCEGSEYVLLQDLISRGADKLLDSIFVEWHVNETFDHVAVCAEIKASARCSVRDWCF